MPAMKPIDLLIITPLHDEEWACHRWFTGSNVPGGGDLKWMLHPAGLSIGLYSFNGMGSVFAAVKAALLLQKYRPKSVLLLGIAAGAKFREPSTRQGNGFNLGDVAYNNSIYYCSYGKIKGKKTQIRALAPLAPDETISFFIRDVAKECEWKTRAKTWYDTFKDEWKNRFNFPSQSWPGQDLRALPADVGSGELVVASEGYQTAVREQYKTADITVFEMEAYAVGKVCRDLGIPFATIRGISDHGKVAKNDQYRLAAALSPSALVSSLVEDEHFVQYIKRIGFPLNDAHSPCLLPLAKTPAPCPYEQAPHDRKCVDLGITVPSAQRALLTRALEHVEPPDYSRSLNDRLGQLNKKEERVVFFYPYSAEETIRLCDPHREVRGAKNLREFMGARESAILNADDRVEIVDTMREIAEAGRSIYPHFRACEDICRRLVGDQYVTEAELPMLMSRVIITSQDLDDFEQDITNLIFLFLLGAETVPTYIMSDRVLRTKVRDDITFFEAVGSAADEGGEFNWLKAVRFFPNSWLLLITGWPCEASGKKLGGERKLVHISGLYAEWKKKMSGRETAIVDREFRGFPHAALRRLCAPQTALAPSHSQPEAGNPHAPQVPL